MEYGMEFDEPFSPLDDGLTRYSRDRYAHARRRGGRTRRTSGVPSARPTTRRKRFSAPCVKTQRFKYLLIAEAAALILAVGFLWSSMGCSDAAANISDTATVFKMAFAGDGAADEARKAAVEHPQSTPRSEWKRGTIPFLFQTDLAWNKKPYAGSDVETAACGPTCLTMVYVGLTGKTDFDPASMAVFSDIEGHSVNGETSWSLMTEGAARLGLHAEEVPADRAMIESALRSGRPIICSVRPGDFTDKGHFIVVAGIASDGTWIIHDPNSAERSSITWDPQRVISQCLNIWAFSA